MKVLFFAFANDPANPLSSLKDEANELFRLLSPGELQQRFILCFDPFATREKIAYYLTQYKDRLALFHYSGHAGRDVLETEDENSHAEGIAHLLSQCPQLQMVFLNGCSTEGQVAALTDHGVPAIIATSAPVDDLKATNFSKRFYQALSVQDNIETAFQLAKGDALTQDGGLSIEVHRGVARRSGKKKEATWGLFVGKEQSEVLDWTLPEVAVIDVPEDFTPNELLINELMTSLAPNAREVRNILRDEEDGEEVDFADKRLAILNSLPAPVAEQLRKLMVPLSDQSKGFDKVSQARVSQLVNTYDTLLELFAHIQLAQLWETLDKRSDLEIPPTDLQRLSHYFNLTKSEKENYNYLPLLKSVNEIFDANTISFFVTELGNIRESYKKDNSFNDACHYLDALKKRVRLSEVDPHEVPFACQQGEQNLAVIFSKLGFLAKYTMTAVHRIDVVKPRHQKTPTFSHSVVKLVKLMGGLEEKHEELESFMDSRSVLLLKKVKKVKNEEEKAPEKMYLNLSPFVIDENAFSDDKSEISKIFFFYHYDKSSDKYSFRHAYKPNDVPLVVSDNNFKLVKLQFEAFAKLVFNKRMDEL